ncbi:MAG: hypothetical protein ACOCYB_06810 [Alkalispirochaeta sp.]
MIRADISHREAVIAGNERYIRLGIPVGSGHPAIDETSDTLYVKRGKRELGILENDELVGIARCVRLHLQFQDAMPDLTK